MGDVTGIGSIISAATDLAKYVIGVNTHTDTITNGGSQQNQDVWTNLARQTNTTQTSDTTKTTNTQTNSDTKTTDTMQNTADPEIIKALKNLASQAIANSTDSGKTTDLLSGIIQKAGDAMSAIFGQQKQAGIYNSASAQSMNNDLISRAAGDAASAILGYKVSQQQLADTSLNQVGNLTAGSTHTIDVANQTNGTSTENTHAVQNTNVDEKADTHVRSETGYLAMSETKGSSKTGMSIICTWMYRNKLLSARRYIVVAHDFERMYKYSRAGYLVIANMIVPILEKDHTSLISRATLAIFTHRNEYVASLYFLPGCKPTWKGWFAKNFVVAVCTPTSLYYFAKYMIGKSIPSSFMSEV